MKRILGLTAAAALVFTTVASAQLLNYPVDVNPHHGNGVGIAGLFGKGLNDNSGKFTSFGAGARIGFGMINIAAGGATTNFSGGSKVDLGERRVRGDQGWCLAICGEHLCRFRHGLGHRDDHSARYRPQRRTTMASAMSRFGPRRSTDLQPDPVAGSFARTTFGVSGGVRLGLPMGLGFGLSMQWVNVENFAPITLGASVGWKFGMQG